MVILVVLVILWAPCVAALLMLRAQHLRTPAQVGPQPSRAEPDGADLDAASQDGPAWSSLDDLQLTRLLIDSARRTITE